MPYAILLSRRLKSEAAIRHAADHFTRRTMTANADPMREARALRGVSDALGAVRERIAEAGTRSRCGSVLAWEMVLSASPGYFRPAGGQAGQWDGDRLEAWYPRAYAFLHREWGDANVVAAYLHLDETTPHIHALCVPIDPHSARLCSTRWFGNRDAMSAVQDRHAEAMAPLGLERGMRGCRATHRDIRLWYAQMQAPLAQVPAPQVGCPPLLLRQSARSCWARAESERLHEGQSEAIASLVTQARSAKEAQRRLREREDAHRRMLRADALDRADARRWRSAQCGTATLGVREAAALFPLADLDRAGLAPGLPAAPGQLAQAAARPAPRDALELIMRVTGHDRAAALRWLAGRRGPSVAEDLAVAVALQDARLEARQAGRQANEPAVLAERWHQAMREAQGERTLLGRKRRLHQHGFDLTHRQGRSEVRERFSGQRLEGAAVEVEVQRGSDGPGWNQR